MGKWLDPFLHQPTTSTQSVLGCDNSARACIGQLDGTRTSRLSASGSAVSTGQSDDHTAEKCIQQADNLDVLVTGCTTIKEPARSYQPGRDEVIQLLAKAWCQRAARLWLDGVELLSDNLSPDEMQILTNNWHSTVEVVQDAMGVVQELVRKHAASPLMRERRRAFWSWIDSLPASQKAWGQTVLAVLDGYYAFAPPEQELPGIVPSYTDRTRCAFDDMEYEPY